MSHFSWSKLDFHLAVNVKDAEHIVVNGVIDLIGKSVGSVEKLVSLIKKYAKKLKPKFGIGTNNFRLELETSTDSNPAESIAESLLILDRISKDHYQKHLNKAAKAMWNEELTEEVFNQIMDITEQHPYYVNYLCDELWSQNDKLPSLAKVNEAWKMVLEEDRSDLLKDFFLLSENQKSAGL
jgi:hypothetical protein